MSTITNPPTTPRLTTAHEYIKHDLTITIDLTLIDLSAAGHDEITDAYHALIQAVALHADDYDQATAAIKDTRRQHFDIQGPF